MVGYLLLVLIPIAAIAYVVWDYKRKIAARAAASSGRLNELLGTAAHVQVPTPAPARASTPVDASVTLSPRAIPSDASPPAPLYASRERVLDPPQTLVYYLLKTGMPDHVVLARVSLASILQAGPGLSGVPREEQTRRLAALTVDFVVADKSMRPVAVIELAASDQGSSAAQADRDSARTRLAAAGVRYLELDARALPRKDTMRSLVLDGDTAHESAAVSEVAN